MSKQILKILIIILENHASVKRELDTDIGEGF